MAHVATKCVKKKMLVESASCIILTTSRVGTVRGKSVLGQKLPGEVRVFGWTVRSENSSAIGLRPAAHAWTSVQIPRLAMTILILVTIRITTIILMVITMLIHRTR